MECEKFSFPGKATAEKARKSMKGKGYDTRTLHTYWCRDCGAYHVGHAWQTERIK